MIYMVEMALLEPTRRAEWDAWYVAHQHRLLTIPGFRASQRFEAIHTAESPFVALHEVDSPDIFAGPHYRAKGGPSNTGEWQAKMGHWRRNLFGADHAPDVPMDARLVVVEAVLDVCAGQPLPQDSELWSLPNVIITPRIAGITSQKWPAVLPVFKENLRRFLTGQPLNNLVDKELGY